MAFTDHQLAQYNAFGFVLLRGLLDAQEMAAFTLEFERGLARAHSVMTRHGNRKQLNWSNLSPESPCLGALLEDARFVGGAEQLFGTVVGHYANSNSFDASQTEWHSDTDDLRRRGVKFAFYLQPLDEHTGALRLIPGSQKNPLHSDIRAIQFKRSNEEVDAEKGIEVDAMPAFTARSEPGDVIVFDNRVWHASWGGGMDRRMCSVGYFAEPESADEEDSLRVLAEQNASLVEAFSLLRPHPQWIHDPAASSRRRQWVAMLQRFGFVGC